MSGRGADPLRLLRETVVTGEDTRVARRRGESIGREMAGAIRAIPVRRRAARVRFAAASAMTFAAVGAAATLWMRKPPASAPVAQWIAPAAPVQAASVVGELAGDVDIVRAGRPAMAAMRAVTLLPGDEVVTGDGGKTTFELPGGASVAMSPASRVRWLSEPVAAPSALRLALAQGRVDLRVPTTMPGGPLVVLTPDAELIVRGTAFMVNVVKAPGRAEGTCVAVSEGVVTLRAHGEEAKLAQGGSWSSFVDRSLCGIGFPQEKATDKAAPAEKPIPLQAKLVAAPRKAKAAPARESRAAAATSLAAENRLFHAAALAHQRGADGEAIRLFDELVRTYPDSALVPEALETRRRAAERLENAGGR